MDRKLRNHKDLDAWKKSMELVKDVYAVTQRFPGTEMYGLVNQMRRAAVSVPSSISEGAGRANKKEFAQFLYIALGSLAELETQLLIAMDLGYVEGGSPTLERLGVVRKLIIGLIYSLKKNVTSV